MCWTNVRGPGPQDSFLVLVAGTEAWTLPWHIFAAFPRLYVESDNADVDTKVVDGRLDEALYSDAGCRIETNKLGYDDASHPRMRVQDRRPETTCSKGHTTGMSDYRH